MGHVFQKVMRLQNTILFKQMYKPFLSAYYVSGHIPIILSVLTRLIFITLALSSILHMRDVLIDT